MRIIVLLGVFFATVYSQAAIFNSQRIYENTKKEFYSNGLELRRDNRVGIGFDVAGVSGTAGLQLEFNFTPESGLLVGFGTGEGYQTFHAAYKKVIGGSNFLPYFVMGYSRWYTPAKGSRSFATTKPSVLGDKFLNDQEKQGSFDEHFLYPGIGIQFVQLKGDYIGSSVSLELDLLLDVDDFLIGPLGSLAMTYYF
ncbi:MAG: hypothetical protein KDD50_15470 [Bdellovibrionales bacterium]|nr:hypothetical protein [Bdellovibrionales bacterium]